MKPTPTMRSVLEHILAEFHNRYDGAEPHHEWMYLLMREIQAVLGKGDAS